MTPEHAPRWLMLALLAFPLAAVALQSDREQPIRIEADSVQIDDLNGVSVYRGNVVYTQGTLRLEADIVHLYHDEHRQIDRIEALGEPVRFRQRLEGDEEDMRAQARRMEYFAQPERLVLEREAWIWRRDAEFTGDYISYDAGQDLISAQKDAGSGRVHIVIPPRRNDPAPDADGPDVR